MVDSNKKVKLLDPKNDYVFKKIFGEKGDEDILMSLINSILKGNPVIKELELLNTEYPKEGIENKGCHFDILAKTDNGISINIEMQYRKNRNLKDRIIYYSDRINVNEYKVGQQYGDRKIISIWVFANNFTERKEAISEIFPCFKENKEDIWEVFTENKRIILFELQKYSVDNENFRDILSGWVNFLQTPEILDNDIIKPNNKELEKAIEKLEYISKNQQDKYIIDAFNDYERDYYNDLNYEKQEGIKEGEKKGREEGLKVGKIEIAKNMLKEGLDVNLISKLSGLTIEEVEKLDI